MGNNEAVLREIYRRFSAGDAEYLYSVLSDDVVWSSSGNRDVIAFAGEWHGVSGVRDCLTTSRRDWDVQKHEPLEFFSAGNDRRFAVRVAIEAVNYRTKGRVRLEKVDLVTMENGKCTNYAEIFDSALAERAVGVGPFENPIRI
jgi:ketosteroid isomerase-like protein